MKFYTAISFGEAELQNAHTCSFFGIKILLIYDKADLYFE